MEPVSRVPESDERMTSSMAQHLTSSPIDQLRRLVCLPNEMRCNGVFDCASKSDERNCRTTPTFPSTTSHLDCYKLHCVLPCSRLHAGEGALPVLRPTLHQHRAALRPKPRLRRLERRVRLSPRNRFNQNYMYLLSYSVHSHEAAQ